MKKISSMCVLMLLVSVFLFGIIPFQSIGDGTDTFTYNFDSDWNLITIPFDVENNTVQSLFNELILGGLLSLPIYGHENGLYVSLYADDLLYPGLGYEVFLNDGVDYNLVGGTAITEDLSIELTQNDWNYLGWIHDEPTTAMLISQSIPGCSKVAIYSDSSGSLIEYTYGSSENNFDITKGMGFTVFVNQSSIWDGSARSQLPQRLSIVSNNYVDENKELYVTICTELSRIDTISGATVEFAGNTYTTDADGTVEVRAPFVDGNQTYTIYANKSGYLDAEKDISVVDLDVTPDPEPDSQLVIDSPSEVDENESFQITVTADDGPVQNVEISFNENTLYTNENGVVTLVAPEVDEDRSFDILASKTGYLSDEASVLVKNIEPQQNTSSQDNQNTTNDAVGQVFGFVYEEQANMTVPIKKAMICIVLSNENNVVTNKCVFTDDDGQYSIFAQPGIYALNAKKTGYETKTMEVSIYSNQSTEVNIKMQKSAEEKEETLADYTLENEKNAGNIAAEVDVRQEDSYVDIYNDDISIEISDKLEEEFRESITITVSADEGTAGTKIVVYLGQTDDKQIVIEYDGQIISETEDIVSFFSSDNQNTEYAIFLSGAETRAVINAPHFSSHTIKISTISEEIVSYFSYVVVISIFVLIIAGAFMVRKSKD